MVDDVLRRARELWVRLAGVPVSFGASIPGVAVSPRSALCPPGWAGIVTLGDEAILTAPDDATAAVVRQALAGLPAAAWTDPAVLAGRIPLAEVLGPATLAYCGAAEFRPPADGGFEVLAAADPAMWTLLTAVPVADAEECGLADITSPAFVVRDGDRLTAAAGHRRWPGDTAHVSVLTVPGHRGRGLAKIVGAAAVADALAAGLLPQWRARPADSRRVALALGFRELGTQLSIRIA
ncbi:GNAT family N-acetyltransferase [Paractinoplanes rishiriensis]|uniref:N-acetyltransferase domain-containing protein n=1 Tax=Paractinoplanes rishiriensis TaxID=1050105 RepID=A0A919K8L3_9ACTN|nr:GNAT family N-acetyltransferase [Actinoplanes rishiriensis]GIF00738.1 hypothetical protein Ari01nite_82020 [Actinoplanes rishiriensis]